MKSNKNKRMIELFMELDIPKWHYSVPDAFYIVLSSHMITCNHIMKNRKNEGDTANIKCGFAVLANCQFSQRVRAREVGYRLRAILPRLVVVVLFIPSFIGCSLAILLVMSIKHRLNLAIQPRYGRRIGESTFASLPESWSTDQNKQPETGQQELGAKRRLLAHR